jgi:hypothetical protein
VSKAVLLHAIKRVGVASLKGGAAQLVNFMKECIAINPSSVGVTLMTKDDDVEVQGAWQSTLLPANGSGQEFGKEPLIWEVTGLAGHCDVDVRQTAISILGEY